MHRAIVRALMAILIVGAFGDAARAATCDNYPINVSSIVNGSTADATPVSTNFTNLLGCANNALAPLASPNFTGTGTFAGSVGIGGAPTHALDVTGNATFSGYLRVGSNSTPANSTAGDFTATRLSIGNGALGTTNGDFMNLAGTMAETTGGAYAVNVLPKISPASDSSTFFRAFNMQVNYNAAGINFTNAAGVSGGAAGNFGNRIYNAGAITALQGLTTVGLVAGGDDASLTSVGTVNAINVQAVTSFTNSLISAISNSYGVHVYNSSANTFVMTNQAGIAVQAISSATNNTGILLGTDTIPAGNFGLYDASTNNNYFAGNVGIGTTSPAQRLQVNGTIRQAGCTTSGTLSANTSGDIICTPSDARLKNVIGDYAVGLDAILRITPRLFAFKSPPGGPIDKFIHAGFIAQDIKDLVPQAVQMQPNGYYAFDSTAVLAVAVNAIKQLEATNKAQTVEIARLQAKLIDDEHRLATIEARLGLRLAADAVSTR